MYQNGTKKNLLSLTGERKKNEPIHFEPGLYPSILDTVVAKNDKIF